MQYELTRKVAEILRSESLRLSEATSEVTLIACPCGQRKCPPYCAVVYARRVLLRAARLLEGAAGEIEKAIRKGR